MEEWVGIGLWHDLQNAMYVEWFKEVNWTEKRAISTLTNSRGLHT